MPDLISVFARWWKFILGLSLLAVVIALLASLLSPKKYLSVATALPANSLMADKARVFNSNIEALYSDFGTPDVIGRSAL
jgi:LPS O-antigen subunit length determinant protein (WzzB/FepE family)